MRAVNSLHAIVGSPVGFSSEPELTHGTASWELVDVSLGPRVGLWKGRLIPLGGVYDHAGSAM